MSEDNEHSMDLHIYEACKKGLLSGHRKVYVDQLLEWVAPASPEALTVCRAWHGPDFGCPGHSGSGWAQGEVVKAQKAVDALSPSGPPTEEGLAERMAWVQAESAKLSQQLFEHFMPQVQTFLDEKDIQGAWQVFAKIPECHARFQIFKVIQEREHNIAL